MGYDFQQNWYNLGDTFDGGRSLSQLEWSSLLFSRGFDLEDDFCLPYVVWKGMIGTSMDREHMLKKFRTFFVQALLLWFSPLSSMELVFMIFCLIFQVPRMYLNVFFCILSLYMCISGCSKYPHTRTNPSFQLDQSLIVQTIFFYWNFYPFSEFKRQGRVITQ